jgi:hypothetical protein
MSESLDRDFARFIEKNGEVLKMLASESSAKLETLWRVLVYIFDFNYLCLYDANDGMNFRKNFECDRSLLKEIPKYELFFDLMKSALDHDKAESAQQEEILKDDLLLVEAVAAIPLFISGTPKVLIICKQLEKKRVEVVQGYVFDNYKLQLYLSVIRNFVRVHEQQRQLSQNYEQLKQSHERLLLSQEQLMQGKTQITLAAIAFGVFALLEGLSSAIGILKESSWLNVIQGFAIILFLVFFSAAIVRLWKPKNPTKLL